MDDSPRTGPALPPCADAYGVWARALAEARRRGGLVARPAPEPRTAEDAFAIQRKVAERMQDRPRGWKTAGPAPDGLPLIAPLLGKTIVASPAALDALADQPLLLEVEFGLRLRGDVADIDLKGCVDGRELIGEVFVALELCRTRLAAPDPPRVLFLADGLANAGLVIGGGVPAGPRFDFAGRRVRLSVSGSPVLERITCSAAGQAADGLLWLARQTAVHGGLTGGTLVITGSLTGVTPLKPGETAHAWIEGVGEAEFTLR